MPPVQKKRLSKKQRDARKKRQLTQTASTSVGGELSAFPLLGSTKKRKPEAHQPTKGPASKKLNIQPKGANPLVGKSIQKIQGKKPQPKKILAAQQQNKSESESEDEEEGTWDTRKPPKVDKLDLDFEGIGNNQEESDHDESEDSEDDDIEEEDDDDEDDEESEVEKPLDLPATVSKQKIATKPSQALPKAPANVKQVLSKAAANVPTKAPAKTLSKVSAKEELSSDGEGDDDEGDDEEDDEVDGDSATLYVNQLPFDATKERITAHFAACGVIECRMCLDKNTKAFRGAAFVVVKDGPKGLALNLSKLGSRVINVRPQLSQPELAAVAQKGQSIRRNIAKQNQSHTKPKKKGVRK